MLQAKLAALPRRVKRLVLASVDTVLVCASVWAAFALRLADPWPAMLAERWWLLVVLPLLSIPVFAMGRMYDAVLRYVGPRFVWDVLRSVAVTALFMPLLVLLAQRADNFSRSVAIIYGIVATSAITGTRFAAHAWLRRGLTSMADAAVIFGSGDAAANLLALLRGSERHRVVAMLDDDPKARRTIVGGLAVHGLDALPELVKRHGVREAFVALDGQRERSDLREIVEQLMDQGLAVRRVPLLRDLVDGRIHLDDVRPFALEELLGRDVVPPREALLDRHVRGRVVLVSGAGGSIGSELARQLVRRAPKALWLLDHAEFALYQIEAELRELAAEFGVELHAALGSVRDESSCARLLREAGVQTVYHAAAYKHVPMVEANELEGLRNNTLGTWAFARAAVEAGVDSFVLVSTDKAVRPTSVMGASKRLAELVLQALERRSPSTTFCMVRFGNVLGSSGSVVPLFRRQIAQGGPVTVTHPEVIRYFMTIPEAAELVIQAGALGEGGEVFVLDMGQPVKIADLARLMIRLAGRRERSPEIPDGDVELVFTGLRPGEKLHEELLIGEGDGRPIAPDRATRAACRRPAAWPGRAAGPAAPAPCGAAARTGARPGGPA